jgi:hypothetical protein
VAVENQRLTITSPLGLTLTHSLQIQSPPLGKLLILLPGRGYSCDRPVLDYIRAMGLQNGYDVLSLTYGFQVNGSSPDQAITMVEVTEAVVQVCRRGYQEVCLVGKSVGSLFSVPLVQTGVVEAARVSLILLTPVATVMVPVSPVRTLAVIGTADHEFGTPTYTAAHTRGDMTWLVLDRLHHGLEELGDWERSVQVLREIVSACERFLLGGEAG